MHNIYLIIRKLYYILAHTYITLVNEQVSRLYICKTLRR